MLVMDHHLKEELMSRFISRYREQAIEVNTNDWKSGHILDVTEDNSAIKTQLKGIEQAYTNFSDRCLARTIRVRPKTTRSSGRGRR